MEEEDRPVATVVYFTFIIHFKLPVIVVNFLKCVCFFGCVPPH